MPDVYLCLDLAAGENPEPAGVFDAADVASILTNAVLQGSTWARTWRAFTDREEAMRHAAANPTVVTIPLAGAETLPLEDMP